MGDSYGAVRGLWWNGPSETGASQNDLAVMVGSSHLAFRTRTHGMSASTAESLLVAGQSVSGGGVIAQTSDQAYFSFSTSGGPVSLKVGVAPFGPMLHARAELRDLSDRVLAVAADPNSLSQVIAITLAPGTYFLVAKSYGGFGDIGQFSVSGTINP